MPITYSAIATTSLTGAAQTNIEFTSIPSSYTDLLVMVSARSTRSATQDQLLYKFNDNTSNLRFLTLEGRSGYTSPNVISFTDSTVLYGGAMPGSTMTASVFGSAMIYIPNYASSNGKTSAVDIVSEGNTSQTYMTVSANYWDNSSAITKITLYWETSGSQFAQYSTASLFGIKKD